MTRVLLIDDDAACRDATRLVLTFNGYEVDVAADGDEALALAARSVPDVLVVDWMLRGRMDGLQVARTLHRRHPEIRVVLITGYPSVELQDEIEQWQGACCLTKPVSPETLMAAVSQVEDPGVT